MLLAAFPSGPWLANCYVVAAEGAHECVVIDPGVQAADGVRSVCEKHGLSVAGVLLTHGHLDHVASAADLADEAGAPVWIHPADRSLLTDAGPGLAPFVAQLGIDLREPRDLRMVELGTEVTLAGLSFTVVNAPGHRPGCVLYRLALPASDPSEAPGEVVFTGDVLFAGTIGRTDLPGGNPDAMLATLRDVVLALPDEARVLPGHGASTTMLAEKLGNPYLHADFLKD